MYRLYKTYINSDGSYFDMEVIHFNCIQEYHKLLNRSLKTCEAHNGVLYKVAYTPEPLYLSETYQRSAVYHISNANNINTLTEFKKCLKEYFPKYINYISNENIIKELNHMSSFVLDNEKLYPNIKRIIEVKGK